jgi:hypothetical protein
MERDKRTTTIESIEWLVSELDGQLQLGAQKQVRKLVRAVLRHPDLTASELWEALISIGTMDSPREWRKEMEDSYQRLRPKERQHARAIMMDYYHMIREFALALSFCSIRTINSPTELMVAMDLHLHANRLAEAKSIAKKCKKALAHAQSAFDAGSLIEALACYHARCRNWVAALETWSLAPRDEPLGRNAAVGIAEVFMAGALRAIGSELTTVHRLMKQMPSEINLTLPGLEEKLLKDTEKDLVRLKQGLEKLLPEKSREHLAS